MRAEALALLAEILRGVPSLPGALCPDWPLVFAATDSTAATDPEMRAYAVSTAVRLCRACRALPACRDWYDALRPSERPYGVIAGRVNMPGGTG